MTRSRCLLRLLTIAVLAGGSNVSLAAVTGIEIERSVPYAEGREFPGVGAYQRLLGRVHFAVNPDERANAQVVDLPLAPRNKQGLVEFSADLEILAPIDPNKARGTLLYDVNNRGRRMALRMFNGDADHFLMRKGYVVVWSGWIAEILPIPDENLPGETLMRLDVPVATDDGKPITGLVRAEIVTNQRATRHNISNRPSMGSYPPTERGLREANLTWRLRESDPRVPVPRGAWRLDSQKIAAPGQYDCLPKIELVMPAGIEPGYIYELIYEARDPVVQGLGLAGIRDLVSFLKHDQTKRNPLLTTDGVSAVSRAVGFGISQSGRCLRMLVYQGFNADEQGRRVFDGLIPHVSGGGLGFFNHRFASPTRYATQHVNHLFPCDMFPFTYETLVDPLSGREDGILRRAREQNVVPKIMHIQNAAEYWHRSGSLVHTDPLGKRDAPIPPEVRIYAVGGAQHGWGNDNEPEAEVVGQLPNNPTDYRPHLRASLVALDAWLREGTTPPPSRYPKIADGTLVGWQPEKSGWRHLPGVRYPDVIQQPELLDYGSEFLTKAHLTQHPPRRLKKYRVLVPACGPDNNERGMLQMPAVAVPLATFTGWNLRDWSIGAENEMTKLRGARIPFARTKAERLAVGDPRPSLLERYRDFDDYLEQFEAAARQLVRERYLLEEDVPRLIGRARNWRSRFEPEVPKN